MYLTPCRVSCTPSGWSFKSTGFLGIIAPWTVGVPLLTPQGSWFNPPWYLVLAPLGEQLYTNLWDKTHWESGEDFVFPSRLLDYPFRGHGLAVACRPDILVWVASATIVGVFCTKVRPPSCHKKFHFLSQMKENLSPVKISLLMLQKVSFNCRMKQQIQLIRHTVTK